MILEKTKQTPLNQSSKYTFEVMQEDILVAEKGGYWEEHMVEFFDNLEHVTDNEIMMNVDSFMVLIDYEVGRFTMKSITEQVLAFMTRCINIKRFIDGNGGSAIH